MKPVQIAMVGCGGRATGHGAVAENSPVVKIVAWTDLQRERAEQLAQRHGGRVARDFDDVLNDEGIEGVVLSLPHNLHHEFGMKAACAGKHIAMEIPITLTLKEADELIAAAERAGVKLLVLHTLRFLWQFRYVKKLLDSGVLGKPIVVRYHAEHLVPPDYFGRQPGALATESGVLHDGDLLRWWIGEVQAITACGMMMEQHSKNVNQYDHLTVLYELEGDVFGETTRNWITRTNEFNQRIIGSVSCTEGTILLMGNQEVHAHSERGALPGGKNSITVTQSNAGTVTEGEIIHFADCIRGREMIVTPQDARRALELTLASRDSARTGRRIVFLK